MVADALIDNLTVFEMLLYTAELKVDMRVPFADKCRKVAGVIDKLALNSCRDVRIGSALKRGISGARHPNPHIQHLPHLLLLDTPVLTNMSPSLQSSCREATRLCYYG